MSSELSLQSVKNWLIPRGVPTPKDDWINSLIWRNFESFQKIWDEFLITNINLTTLPFKDFDEFTSPCLKLSRSAVVQINEVVDISLPSPDRVAFKQSPKGTLKFLLTYGNQIFIGIEKEKLDSSVFNTTLTPGCKASISEGTEFRYGVLFLKPSNIKLLAGSSASDLVAKRKFIYQKEGQSPQVVPTQEQTNQVRAAQNTQVAQTLPPTPQASTPNSEPKQPKSYFEYSSDEDEIDENFLYSQLANQKDTTRQNEKTWRLEDAINEPPVVGKVYYVDAEVSELVDVHLNGDELKVIVLISGNGTSVKTCVEKSFANELLSISSADEWRNLADDEEFIKKSQANYILEDMGKPLRIVEINTNDDGIRFELCK
jgi:hypothetical protein